MFEFRFDIDITDLDNINSIYEKQNPKIHCYVIIPHITLLNEINSDSITIYYGKDTVCTNIIKKAANDCNLTVYYMQDGRMKVKLGSSKMVK